MIRRLFWLTLFFLGVSWLVGSGVNERRFEARVRSMLLDVQTALQDYHVDQERYLPREELSGAEVITVLADFGFLDELPINPWSGEFWKLDGAEPDFLLYRSDPAFETYALRALHPRTGRVILELDSETNRSLE